MRAVYALVVFIVTLLVATWSAFRAFYVALDEGFALIYDVLTGP